MAFRSADSGGAWWDSHGNLSTHDTALAVLAKAKSVVDIMKHVRETIDVKPAEVKE